MKNQTHFDVMILGGGPAGAATALMLRQHAPHLTVALAERSHYEDLRIGETLPPTVQPLLEQLGIWDAFLADGHLAAYGSCSVWGSDALEENEFIYNPLGRGWHLDRRRFDALLTRSAEVGGVNVMRGAKFTASARTDNGRWKLNLRTDAREEIVWTASLVVDATGRNAYFAQAQGVKRVLMDRLIGAAVFFSLPEERPAIDTYTLVEAVPDGWWYSALVPDGRIAVVFMTDADLLRSPGTVSTTAWFERLKATRHTQARLTGAEPLAEPTVKAANSHRLEHMAGDGWIAVGDAAMTYDPLSSLGIFKGLRSGTIAAYACSDELNGLGGFIKYNQLLVNEFESYLLTRLDFYRQEQRWPDSRFWSRRHDQILLDPANLLRSTAKAGDIRTFDNLSMHLSVDDLAHLCNLCRSPRSASEVVRKFTGQGRSIPDRRVILALQYLVEKGMIDSAAA